MAALSTSLCRLSWCAVPSARPPSAAARLAAAVLVEGARGHDGTFRACSFRAPKSIENTHQPHALFFGRLPPHRASRHVVDKLTFVVPQLVGAPLAPQRDLVPGRGSIDIAKIARSMLCIFSFPQAVVEAGVVNALRVRLRKRTVRLLGHSRKQCLDKLITVLAGQAREHGGSVGALAFCGSAGGNAHAWNGIVVEQHCRQLF